MLGVKALVTGSVVRTGDTVKIAAQLVDATDEHQVWGADVRTPSEAMSRPPE